MKKMSTDIHSLLSVVFFVGFCTVTDSPHLLSQLICQKKKTKHNAHNTH